MFNMAYFTLCGITMRRVVKGDERVLINASFFFFHVFWLEKRFSAERVSAVMSKHGREHLPPPFLTSTRAPPHREPPCGPTCRAADMPQRSSVVFHPGSGSLYVRVAVIKTQRVQPM